MKNAADWLVYLGVRIAICVVQAAPMETCAACADVLAWLLTAVIPIRRQVIEENLRCAFPEMTDGDRRKLTLRMWRHLFLMVFEVAHAPIHLKATDWRRRIRSRSHGRISRLLLDPRPKIVVSAHFGNFEIAGYVAGLLGFPGYTIARPLDNRYLDRYVNRFRRSTGQAILPKQGSAETVQRIMDEGGVIGLLGDQHAGPKGCWVDFFGRPASSHKAVALFCLAYDAPLIVLFAIRGSRPFCFDMDVADILDPRTLPPSCRDVRWITQWYHHELEAVIRRSPEQYWWVHRRWKGTPPGNRKAAEGEKDREAA